MRIARYLKPMPLAVDSVLGAPEAPTRHVYFITSGLASCFSTTQTGHTVQNDLTGREGLVGGHVVLGYDSLPNCITLMEVAGSAFKIETTSLLPLLNGPGKLPMILKRYAASKLVRVMQTAVCNRLHPIQERLACWLLMASDRMGTEFSITHDRIADMLGSRRVTLTLRAQELQRAEIIRYRYGRIRILNRPRLEGITCECYRIHQREYDNFLRS